MNQQKIADRIRKLLALSRSANQHEAAVAAMRAAELMAEHQLEVAMLDDDAREPVQEQVLDGAGRIVAWRGCLVSGIAYSFGCRAYWSRNTREGGHKVNLMVVGRASDLDALRYTYNYLSREIDRLTAQTWNAMHSDKSFLYKVRSWKNAFRMGAANTINGRLRQARDEILTSARSKAKSSDQLTAALVRVSEDQADVVRFMEGLGPLRRTSSSVGSSSGLNAGSTAGHAVELGRDHSSLAAPARSLGPGA